MTSRSAAVKRLMKELMDLRNDPCPEFTASPLDDNVFEWHFTIRGPSEGGFQGGRYHGRIVFPVDYPFKPPNIFFLTPNGRFELGKKICLSITSFHQETWRPAWGLRTALIALISFMTTNGEGAIGALDYDEETRAVYAKRSKYWVCGICGCQNATCLPDEADAPVQKLERDPEIGISVKEAATNNTGCINNLENGSSDRGQVTGGLKGTEFTSPASVCSTSEPATIASVSLPKLSTTAIKSPLPSVTTNIQDSFIRQRRLPAATRTIPAVQPIQADSNTRRLYFVFGLIILIVVRRVYMLLT